MVAHVFRFWPEYVVLKKIYDSGRYGPLRSGIMHRLGSIPKMSWNNWMQDEPRSGGVLYDLHIHDLDFLVHSFGVPDKVTPYRNKQPGQDYLLAIYIFRFFHRDRNSLVRRYLSTADDVPVSV